MRKLRSLVRRNKEKIKNQQFEENRDKVEEESKDNAPIPFR